MVNLGTVWDRSAAFLRGNLAVLAQAALWAVFAPLYVLNVALPGVGPGGTAGDVAFGVAALAASLWLIWGGLVVTAAALDPAIGMRGFVRAASAGFWAALALSLAELVVAGAVILPLALLIGAGGSSGLPVSGIGGGAGVVATVYVPLALVICLSLAARLILVNPVLVAERAGIRAVLRSFRLTSGMTVKLMGVVILYLIVTQVSALATKLVVGTAAPLAIGEGAAEAPLSLTQIASALPLVLVETGFSVTAAVFSARLFIVLRDVRETIVELS